MRSFLLILVPVFLYAQVFCQDFISSGKIQFEIKKNIKSMRIKNGNNNDFTSSLPEFEVATGTLLFSQEAILYKKEPPERVGIFIGASPESGTIYTNLQKQQTVIQKTVMGNDVIYTDSIKKIKWQITNETRNIIGFNCRKAIGRIFDSVYVVAFYAVEILPQGGPEMFTGLPGLILGLAIPRYYTTWFATKLEMANIDESAIVPPTSKKIKPATRKETTEMLFKKTKDSYGTKQTAQQIDERYFASYVL